MSSLNIDSAIGAHVVWKRRFEFAVDGIIEQSIAQDKIGDDTHCVLGNWLFGSGQEYADHQFFQELLVVHRDFHVVAAQIAGLIDDGQIDVANNLIRTHFSDLSEAVVGLLTQLREHVNRNL